MKVRLLFAATIALVCAGAAPAAAWHVPQSAAAKPPAPRTGKPFLVAEGGQWPWLFVDENGSGHMAWQESSSGPPDVDHYCQVKRDATSCSAARSFAPTNGGGYDFVGPKVVVTDQGDVVLLTNRCCSAGSGTYGYVSANGGASFQGPSLLGSNAPSGDAEFGPGAYSITTVTDTESGGTFAQTVQFEGGSPVYERAQIDSDVSRPGPQPHTVYDGSAAMVDPTTPIVAYSDLSTVYYRRWSGSGSVNSTASWLPSKTLGPGSYPRLSGGPKGVFMMYGAGAVNAGVQRWVVARYDSQRGTFGAPVTLDTEAKGRLKFRDFWQDRSGNLHAVWMRENLSGDHLEYAISRDGRTWSAVREAATVPVGMMFDLHVRTGPDGGGFAVWNSSTSGGGIMAVALAPLGKAGGGTCPTELRFGVAHALAKQGCFAKHGFSYSITEPVRINGLDVDPPGGAMPTQWMGPSAMPTLTIDPSRGSLSTAGPVTVAAGPVKLGRQRLDWVIPRGGGGLTDGGGNPVTLEAGRFGTRLMGLPLSGYVTPQFRREAADLPVNLVLPQPVDGALGGGQSSSVVLRTDQNSSGGLVIDKGHFHLHVDEAFFGIAHLKPIDIEYTADPEVLSGHVGIYLPVVANSKLDSTFLFRQGEFADATAVLSFGSPGLPVASVVYLNEINFHAHAFTSCSDPTTIGGGVVFSGGPRLLGATLVRIEGNVTYAFPKGSCGLPGVLTVSGTGYLVDFQVADVRAVYKTSGYFGFGAHIDVGSPKTIRVYAGIDGAVDFATGKFYASGDATVSALGFNLVHAETIVSSIGIGACVTLVPLLPGVSVDGGFSYKWGKHLSLMLPDCDISDLKPSGVFMRMTSSGLRQVATFTVPAGVPSYGVAAFGPGGPTVTLVDPQGRRITTPRPGATTDSGPGLTSFRLPGLGETGISLKSPVPGVWRVEAPPGVALDRVLTGDGHPKPSVQARVVRGAGRAARLVYRVRPIAGQTVRFAEQGPDTNRIIGLARAASGTVRFQAGDGRRGSRAIVALVEQDGFPRAQIVV
ncbi:MAG: hypothetical protein M3R70_13670, partial [Actinomycetota bacterium]|nr:hypothetical protein [Actinomycetota bacterium]